jgi:hypothetical protein
MIHVRRGDVNMFCESREQADLFLVAGYTEVTEDEKTEATPEKKKKTK